MGNYLATMRQQAVTCLETTKKHMENCMEIILRNVDKYMVPSMILSVTITSLPIVPLHVSSMFDLLYSLISAGTTWIIYQYYHSLPEVKKTVFTYLMQCLVSAVTIDNVLWTSMSMTLVMFPDFVETWLEAYPNLTCSLLAPEIFYLLPNTCIFFIILFKIVIVRQPLKYLEMNHERAVQICLQVFGFLYSVEIVSMIAACGTTCSKGRLGVMEQVYGYKLNTDKFKMTPPIASIHSIVMVSPQLIYLWFQRRLAQRQVAPKPIVSTVTMGTLTNMIVNVEDVEENNEERQTEEKYGKGLTNVIYVKPAQSYNEPEAADDIQGQVMLSPNTQGEATAASTSASDPVQKEAEAKPASFEMKAQEAAISIQIPEQSNSRLPTIASGLTQKESQSPPNSIQESLLKMTKTFRAATTVTVVLIITVLGVLIKFAEGNMAKVLIWVIHIGIKTTIFVIPLYWVCRGEDIKNFAIRKIKNPLN